MSENFPNNNRKEQENTVDLNYAQNIREYWGSIGKDFILKNPKNTEVLRRFFLEQADNFSQLSNQKKIEDLQKWPDDIINEYGDGLPMMSDFFMWSLYLEKQGYTEEDKQKGGVKELMDNRREMFLATVFKLFKDVLIDYGTKDTMSSFLDTIQVSNNNYSISFIQNFKENFSGKDLEKQLELVEETIFQIGFSQDSKVNYTDTNIQLGANNKNVSVEDAKNLYRLWFIRKELKRSIESRQSWAGNERHQQARNRGGR